MSVEKAFKLYRRRNKKWWELLPLRDDFSLLLARNEEFWGKCGQDFGWFSKETPYETALRELEEVKEKINDYKQVYEQMGIFGTPLHKSKVGSWCYWVSVKKLLQL